MRPKVLNIVDVIWAVVDAFLDLKDQGVVASPEFKALARKHKRRLDAHRDQVFASCLGKVVTLKGCVFLDEKRGYDLYLVTPAKIDGKLVEHILLKEEVVKMLDID